MGTGTRKQPAKRSTNRTRITKKKAKSEPRPKGYDDLRREELLALLEERDRLESGGLRLAYTGQTPPWQIVRRVQPRCQRIEKRLCTGDEEYQAMNLVMEGENLQAMVSLYKYRGQIDLGLTDPPYNTGQDFRYNDRWDEDPNDPDLGQLVPEDDGSRHSKWLRFMTPRIWMMREMIRPGGVFAICIDHRELYRLGILLDQIFGEGNRLGVINWQKSYAPRNDKTHLSSATEYVLVYAKNDDRAATGLLPRTETMNARYKSSDGDPRRWKESDITAPGASTHPGMLYAIQSPFTGELHYPSEGRCWGAEKKRMKNFLEAWGPKYVEKELDDGMKKALVIKGAPLSGDDGFDPKNKILTKARRAAEKILKAGNWPEAYWGAAGQGVFAMKRYLEDVKQGMVPTTYWAADDYDVPFEIENSSWGYKQSGHSQTGVNELNDIVGKGHGFETVKPLKLFKKIIQLWCPPDGVVLDPFAGSGTTGHAVLDLNHRTEASRRFILIEQGRPDRGDSYARGLTAERVRRVIRGERAKGQARKEKRAQALDGGFRFTRLTDKIDGEAVLALEREEMVDLLLTTHWDQNERAGSHLRRLPAGAHEFLFAVTGRGEGFFLVWHHPDRPSILNRQSFRAIVDEAKAANLKSPYHVYARICTYSGPNIEFYQIPDRILEKIGFNAATEPFNTRMEGNS